MKKELDEALCKDFPSICRDRFASPVETPFAFGFEIGDGWEPLVRLLFRFIDNAIENAQSSVIFDYKTANGIPYMTDLSHDIENELISGISVTVEQVKEKYGSLRLYVHSKGLPPRFEYEIDGAISFAENWSTKVCETCGNPGILRGPGWLFTACEEHAKGVKPLKEYLDFKAEQEKKKAAE